MASQHPRPLSGGIMEREDGYYCFECAYFSGGRICYKNQSPLMRKGWEAACGKFVLQATADPSVRAKAKKLYEKYNY